MSEVLKIGIDGQSNAPRPLDYKACGVDGVQLLNGFEIVEDDDGFGGGYSVQDVDSLHKQIGLSLALMRPTLTHKDIKFLRKQLGLTQSELAKKLGLESQMIGRYERNEHPISGPAERLLRILYISDQWPEAQADIMTVVTRLHADDDLERGVYNLVFERSHEHWKAKKEYGRVLASK